MNNNNENNTTSLTLEQAWSLWQTAKAEVRRAQEAEHVALRTIAKAAGSKTFTFNNQLYQVRERMNKDFGCKTPFMCELKRPPSEWLAKAREVKIEKNQNPVDALAAETEETTDTSLSGTVTFSGNSGDVAVLE